MIFSRAFLVGVIAILGFASNSFAADDDGPLTFDKVFDVEGKPAASHYVADFLSRGGMHKMEVWRDGDTQIKRVTDKALETYVTREAGSPEFEMTILDISRKIVTRIDRAGLYKVGNFTDWFDLAHGIKRPPGAYQLVKGRAPMAIPIPASPCTWYEMTQAGVPLNICWDSKNKIPMFLVGEYSKIFWQVTAVDQNPIPAGTFEVHDEGYVRNDVKQEMDKD